MAYPQPAGSAEQLIKRGMEELAAVTRERNELRNRLQESEVAYKEALDKEVRQLAEVVHERDDLHGRLQEARATFDQLRNRVLGGGGGMVPEELMMAVVRERDELRERLGISESETGAAAKPAADKGELDPVYLRLQEAETAATALREELAAVIRERDQLRREKSGGGFTGGDATKETAQTTTAAAARGTALGERRTDDDDEVSAPGRRRRPLDADDDTIAPANRDGGTAATRANAGDTTPSMDGKADAGGAPGGGGGAAEGRSSSRGKPGSGRFDSRKELAGDEEVTQKKENDKLRANCQKPERDFFPELSADDGSWAAELEELRAQVSALRRKNQW